MRRRARFLRTAQVIAGRELRSFFLSPVAAVVGALFLVLEGLSFWGLVDVLSNPAEPAPYGAVLRTFFGGTTLYWAILFAVIAALTMHLFADEKRTGTWETLFTAGASEAGITAGKYVAALAVYLILWAPTVTYILVIGRFAPADAGLEPGPVVGAYLGVTLVGAALIALGLFASSLTSLQVVAALLSFSLAMVALLAGELGGVGSSARAHMFDLAGGLISADIVLIYVGIAATLLLATHAAAARGRRRRGEVVRRTALSAAVAIAVVALAVLSGRVPASIDLTRDGVHSLEPETALVLERLEVPLDALIVAPTIPGFAGVFEQVEAVLSRMAAHQPQLRVRSIDPAGTGSDAADLIALAREFGLPVDQLREGGAVVFQSGARRRLLDVTEVADFERDALGAGHMASFWAESAFAQAIAEVSDRRSDTVCASIGSGELPIADTGAEGLDWALVGERLRRDGVTVREIALGINPVEGCDGLLVIGPRVALTADAALAVSALLDRGGSLLVAVRSQPTADERSPLASSGLELILAGHEIRIAPAVVIDPEHEIGVPFVWSTYDGYGDHPVTSSFRGRRATVWPAPRAIESASAQVLVHGSVHGWAERDLDAVYGGRRVEAGAGESLAEVPVAVAARTATGGHIVAFGSAEFASSQLAQRGLGAGHLLAERSIRWMLGREVASELADKSPEHMRLLLSANARRGVFAIVVIALPLCWLMMFALLWWRRRG